MDRNQKLEFIKGVINEWTPYFNRMEAYFDEPEEYLSILDSWGDYPVFIAEREDIDELIEEGYEQYAEDIKVGEWVCSDSEVLYPIERSYDDLLEEESKWRKGEIPDISTIIIDKFRIKKYEEQIKKHE